MTEDSKKSKDPRKPSIWLGCFKFFQRKHAQENEQTTFLPFKILRLPSLALIHCVQSMDVFTLLNFSQLSRRAQRLVTTSTRNKVGIRLEFSYRSSLILTDLNKNDWFSDGIVGGEKNEIRILNRTYTTVFKEEASRYRLKLRGLEKDIIELAEHLTLIFGSSIREFVLHAFEIGSTHLFEWLKTHQTSIDYLIVIASVISSKVLGFIFHGFQINKMIYILPFVFPFFPKSNKFKCRQMIRAPKIIILESRWVTLNTVDYMESSFISLKNSSLTPMDLNLIMKNFMIGWNRNLEYFEVKRNVEEEENPELVFELLTKDLNYRKHVEDDRRPKSLNLQPNFEIPMANNFDLLKRDQVIATFCHYYEPHRQLNNVFTHVFHLHAWKNNKNN